MEPPSVIILKSSGSFGMFHSERQDGNSYYLTGLNEPEALLVLHSRSKAANGFGSMKSWRTASAGEILFVMPQDPNRSDWEALPWGIETVKQKLGFKDVRPSTESPAYLEGVLLGSYDQVVDITSEAQIATMRSIKSGMHEYQIPGIIEYTDTRNGAQKSAFPSIIGTGPNSCVLHGELNSRKMQYGDFVVVDIGTRYKFYGTDITRTLLVNGKSNKRQAEVYEIVLKANLTAIEMVAPCVKSKAIHDKAAEIVGEGLVQLGFIKDKSEFRNHYFHGLGHSIGLRVGGRSSMDILETWMVITIEPGIYIRE